MKEVISRSLLGIRAIENPGSGNPCLEFCEEVVYAGTAKELVIRQVFFQDLFPWERKIAEAYLSLYSLVETFQPE
jgi:hypothetical protein